MRRAQSKARRAAATAVAAAAAAAAAAVAPLGRVSKAKTNVGSPARTGRPYRRCSWTVRAGSPAAGPANDGGDDDDSGRGARAVAPCPNRRDDRQRWQAGPSCAQTRAQAAPQGERTVPLFAERLGSARPVDWCGGERAEGGRGDRRGRVLKISRERLSCCLLTRVDEGAIAIASTIQTQTPLGIPSSPGGGGGRQNDGPSPWPRGNPSLSLSRPPLAPLPTRTFNIRCQLAPSSLAPHPPFAPVSDSLRQKQKHENKNSGRPRVSPTPPCPRPPHPPPPSSPPYPWPAAAPVIFASRPRARLARVHAP